MPKLKYTPDADIPLHTEGAINLLCRPFQSHETGLPEWIKNASDEYLRRDSPAQDRFVVVLLSNASGGNAASISCLDCCGMNRTAIERQFRVWAHPDASRQGLKGSLVQGGHGNGGKCYMTQMFTDYSLLNTVTNGRGNVYGVAGGTIHFGYVPNPQSGRDVSVTDVIARLETSLQHTGVSAADLPAGVVQAIRASGGFTLVTGVGPKGYKGRIPIDDLIESIQDNPQMLQPLQLCKVVVIANGKAVFGGQALALPEIEPMAGGETAREVAVPPFVTDPLTNVKCSTTDDGRLPEGKLVLRTSNASMRTGKRKSRHLIVFKTPAVAGYVSVPELDVQSTYRERIYGECHLAALDSLKQNERMRLADAPLSRAIARFVAFQVQKYAEEFEIKDKRSYSQKEKDAISEMNEFLDHWKNRFIRDVIHGPDGPEPPPAVPLPVGTPFRLEVALTDSRIGRGVSIRPSLRFFERSGARIRPVPFRWVSDDTNVAMVDEDLGIINSFAYGQTTIFAETLDGSVRSNSVPLEVVRITGIRLEPSMVEVPVGGRSRLTAICKLADGSEASDVMLIWTEDDSGIARLSASGFVFGAAVGETNVTAGDDAVTSPVPARIKVVKGEGKDGGFPRVLVSGNFERDPDTNDYVTFSSDDPPVAQRPEDANRFIWWINSAAPLARLYLDTQMGYGYKSIEWRMYHLERYIDVIVQIALKYGGDGNQGSIDEWILLWGAKAAEVQGVAVTDLAEFIGRGTLPEI